MHILNHFLLFCQSRYIRNILCLHQSHLERGQGVLTITEMTFQFFSEFSRTSLFNLLLENFHDSYVFEQFLSYTVYFAITVPDNLSKFALSSREALTCFEDMEVFFICGR